MIKIIQTYSPMILQALGNTVLLCLLSLCIAMVIGLSVALLNVSRNSACNFIGTAYVDAPRGVPLIVLAYFIYFGLPAGVKSIGQGILSSGLADIMGGFGNSCVNFRLSAIQAGTAALSMNCGAYMAEIIRAGIESVDRGQMEASRALGLNYSQSMRLVILPQAIKTMIPSIINQFIITLKDTSILSVIGFGELTNVGKTIAGNTFKSLEAWTIIGIVYMIVIITLSKVAKRIERILKND